MTKWIKFGAHTYLSVVLEPAHFYSTSQTGERFIFNWVKNNWVNIAVFPSPKLLIPGKFPGKKKKKGGRLFQDVTLWTASWVREAGWRREALSAPGEGKAQIWVEVFLDTRGLKRERYYECSGCGKFSL